MTRAAAISSTSRRRLAPHSALFATVSALTLFVAASDVSAKPLGGSSAPPVATAPAVAPEAGQAALQAQAALKRATQAIQAMQAAQRAAREAAAAAASNIPNGLQTGGLQVKAGAVPGSQLWQGASGPTQTVSGARTKVGIEQTQAKAILTWETFNISKDTDLTFDQKGNKDWIALNRVLDASAMPSRILGNLKADGQVYVINRNGIIFGAGSQVNVGTLIASSLALSDEQFMAGINRPLPLQGDLGGNGVIVMPQFGYLGQQQPNGWLAGDPNQVPGAVIGAPPGDVRVEADAEITTASGGKAMLFAPHVFNSGRISAPDGQVIMAAGEQVYLTSSTSVRGLDVAVSAPMRWLFTYDQLLGAMGRDTIYNDFTLSLRDVLLSEMEARAAAVGYRVVNDGIVQADRGNITLMGRDIVQNGALLASTALNNRDGSIRLLAWDQGMACSTSSNCSLGMLKYWSTGTVTLGSGSVTASMPDLSDTDEIELAALATRYKPGQIDVRGAFINVEAQANVVVPAGTINLVASAFRLSDDPATPRDGSRIYIGEEAYLSVAGLQDVAVAMERNFIEAQLGINELRDSPLYRESFLRGLKVIIDRRRSGQFTDGPMAGVDWIDSMPGSWIGTPLADVAAWVGVGKTDLAELSTKAGSITIRSGGSVITRKGSLLDVSGGSVRYSDGWNTTTGLLDANGLSYDIGSADPGQLYIALDEGFTRHNARWGVTQTWKNPLSKNAPRFEKGYTEGRNAGSIQFHAGEAIVLEGGYWGGVIVGERQAAIGNLPQAGSLTFGGASDEDKQWLPGNVIISSNPVPLPANFNATGTLDASWYAGGPDIADSFRRRTTHLDADVLSEAGMGKIQIYVSANVSLTEGTVLDLAPGSTFSVIANSTAAYTQDFQIDGVIRAPGGTVRFFDAENLTFGSHSALDLSGQWINELTHGVSVQAPVTKGGTIELMNARFEAGAVFDVSGGGWLQTGSGKPKLKVGDAGQILLGRIHAEELANMDLRGYSAGSGGHLTFSTDSSLQIGGAAPSAANTIRLSETLFSERGFRSVDIGSSGSITVPGGVTVSQTPLTLDLLRSQATGAAAFATLPVSERLKLKPTSLLLTAGTVKIEQNAVVRTDIGGTITLETNPAASGGIEIAGMVEALAGKISLIAPGRTIRVTDTGALVARGIPVIEIDGRGLRSGTVLGGGSVRLDGGSVVLEQDSVLDVSGARGEIEVPQSGGLNKRTVQMALASAGGSVTLTGQGLVEGVMYAHAGGNGARGGSISLASSAGGIILSETATAGSGLIVRPSNLQSSGFADLVLSSTTRLDGVDLALTGSITAGGPLVNGNGTDSRLSASYILLSGGAANSAARAGILTLAASVIDVTQAGIDSFEQTVLEASDIRLLSGNQGQAGLLDVGGILTLRAGQVYAMGLATVRASDKIVVQQRGDAGTALSVGAVLTLEAPVIEQGGTLRAPFGEIVLKASDTLTLLAGSVTSVSGDGLILPYGALSNNEHWTITAPGQEPQPITALPEKRITLDAPNVAVAAGSVIDIRGGGDLYASEHVPGPGGSHNVLARPGMFAILPALDGAAVTDAGIRAGDRVWLDGGNGLAAGWYTLLPAQYALLPGAYAVQMVGGSQGTAPSKSSILPDGSLITGGYRSNANDGSRDQQTSSWRVMSGEVIRAYSEYNEAFANSFFASDAFKLAQYRLTGGQIVTPRLPMDGGSVVFKATQDLILNGQLRSQAAAGGRGGLVDIAAAKIAILGLSQDAGTLRADGYLVIDATTLSGFGAGSLLIGGVRSGDAQGLKVDVTADEIVVRNDGGSALTGAEIILAASDTIEVGAGSVITARGTAPTGAGDLVMAPQVAEVINDNGTPSNPNDDYIETPERDWGALIRISNGDAVRVRRDSVDTAVGGEVTIGAGAVIDGGKALLIDATRNALVTEAKLSGASLSLASGSIGFGGGSGLVLDAAALAALGNTQHLTLRSYSSIEFHSSVDLSGLSAATFDAAALVGFGTNHVTIVGNRLVLENTASTFSEPVGTGHGSLSLVANELTLGEGAKALRGFDTVTLTGTTRMVGEGTGSLHAGAAAVTLSAEVLTGRGGAAQSLTTGGALNVTRSGAAAPARDEDSLGARWSLTGSEITLSGRVHALGGAVELTATDGDVVLANGASIDVGGFGKQFFDVAEYTDAGRIALTAQGGGSVRMMAGAVLDLAAHQGGGGAGSLVVTSDGGDVVLYGTIKAQAAAGQRGGSFALDIAALPDFAAFNQRLNLGGFSESRQFRIRSGSVTVDGTTIVRDFRLVTDQGSVTIAGTVDARNTYGGEIAIYAGNGLTMTSGAVLRAGATDTADNLGSGRITLGVNGGALNIQGGLIHVGGGEGGKVTLRAPVIEQPGTDTVNVGFAGNITGAREIVLEGYKSFDLAALAADPNFVGVTINGAGQAELDLAATTAGKLNVLADYGAGTLVEFVQDFDISAAYGALSGLADDENFHARPGMELNHSGDIVLKSNWNLGAGVVDEAGALAAGVMAIDPILNKAYVVASRKGELLRDHTNMVYRTDGSVQGEAGVLALRAGGDLILEGGITDGFFGFGDTLDPGYLATANTFIGDYTLRLNGGFSSLPDDWSPLSSWSDFINGGASGVPFNILALGFGTWESVLLSDGVFVPASSLNVPYSAAANTPAARGQLPGGKGDPLRSAELFPSITTPDGAEIAPSSWSYILVAGAAAPAERADPLQRAAGAAGSIVLKGLPGFSYAPEPPEQNRTVEVDLDPWFFVFNQPNDWDGQIPIGDWLNYILGQGYSGISADSVAVISAGQSGDDPARGVFDVLLNEFVAEHGLVQNSLDPALGYGVIDDWSGYNILLPIGTYETFFAEKIIPNLSRIISSYSLPNSSGPSVQTGIVPHAAVRTGTGDINIAANRDIQLSAAGAIYTAGRRDFAVFDDFTSAPADAAYGIQGGHLRVTAGGKIEAALPADRGQMQHYVEWLKRQGRVDASYLYQPGQQSSWWVDSGNFQGGVGALGGGNVTVGAGGDLVNLTVALPTNGRVRGGRSVNERKLLELRNGGALTIDAGGAIKAGYYYIGRGAGTIEASELAVGREVEIAAQNRTSIFPISPILSLGDATMNVRTTGNLLLQTVLDPLLVGDDSYMSGQTNRTALSLTSTGGDVILVGQATYLSKDLNIPNNGHPYEGVNSLAGNLYPSKIRISALNGSVINQGPIYALPGSAPELRILASNDVNPGAIVMSRATLEMVPSPFEPVGGNQFQAFYTLQTALLNDIVPPSNLAGHLLHLQEIGNPEHLPNENDYEPSRIYSLNGSIVSTIPFGFNDVPVVFANEQTWFRAGMDVRNLNYRLRNIHPTDVSLIEAGNDIIGASIQGVVQSQGLVQIQGPGTLVLSAGRDVYSPSLQLYSTGNRQYDTNNRPIDFTEILGLPDQGAAITVMAGLNGKRPSYDAFLAGYLDPANVAAMPDYLTRTLPDGTRVPLYLTDGSEERDGQQKVIRRGLVSYIEEMTGETLSPLDAWARFQVLPELVREAFVRRVYMQELREAGRDQLTPDLSGRPQNGGYNRGYAAIATLFPGDDWKGDVAIGNAMFRTMAGGDINVLTPGGALQVAALGEPVPDNFGLVALGPGNIEIFAKKSVTVNRSRVLTFGGGDETLWSTLGDVDAGRGAKTVRVPSSPEIVTDVNAITRVLERADISGSGVGTIIGFTGVVPGDVDLIAPLGTVNAGDAGIRVSGNLNLAALHVANAANIEVGGKSKGVPVIEAPDIGGLTEASNTAGAAQQAGPPQNTANEQPSIIIVEVLGFGGGDGEGSPESEEEHRRKRSSQNQDPSNRVQVLDAGALTAARRQELVEEKRRLAAGP
jgi:filamentous hemagglutinin family protein